MLLQDAAVRAKHPSAFDVQRGAGRQEKPQRAERQSAKGCLSQPGIFFRKMEMQPRQKPQKRIDSAVVIPNILSCGNVTTGGTLSHNNAA